MQYWRYSISDVRMVYGKCPVSGMFPPSYTSTVTCLQCRGRPAVYAVARCSCGCPLFTRSPAVHTAACVTICRHPPDPVIIGHLRYYYWMYRKHINVRHPCTPFPHQPQVIQPEPSNANHPVHLSLCCLGIDSLSRPCCSDREARLHHCRQCAMPDKLCCWRLATRLLLWRFVREHVIASTADWILIKFIMQATHL